MSHISVQAAMRRGAWIPVGARPRHAGHLVQGGDAWRADVAATARRLKGALEGKPVRPFEDVCAAARATAQYLLLARDCELREVPVGEFLAVATKLRHLLAALRALGEIRDVQAALLIAIASMRDPVARKPVDPNARTFAQECADAATAAEEEGGVQPDDEYEACVPLQWDNGAAVTSFGVSEAAADELDALGFCA